MSASIWSPSGAGLGGGQPISFNGVDPGFSGMWPDVTATARIVRLRDRLFMGDAAVCTGNNSGTQGGKIPTGVEGASWGIRDAQFVSFATNGNIGVAGYTRSQDTTREPCPAIGVAGFAIGNFATRSVWALYGDVQHEVGPYAYGLELAVKNKGANKTSTPYYATEGTYGIWLPAGGDNSYGGAAANPNNTAIAIGKNASTWNKGLVFFAESITGTDGVTGTGTAIEMAKGHRVVWRAPGNFTGFSIRSEVSTSSSDVAMTATNNNISFTGANGNSIFQLVHTSGAVNYLAVSNTAGVIPTVLSTGTDTDVHIGLSPKGSGSVVIAGIRSFANDADAAAASPPVPLGGLYRNGSALQIRVS